MFVSVMERTEPVPAMFVASTFQVMGEFMLFAYWTKYELVADVGNEMVRTTAEETARVGFGNPTVTETAALELAPLLSHA